MSTIQDINIDNEKVSAKTKVAIRNWQEAETYKFTPFVTPMILLKYNAISSVDLFHFNRASQSDSVANPGLQPRLRIYEQFNDSLGSGLGARAASFFHGPMPQKEVSRLIKGLRKFKVKTERPEAEKGTRYSKDPTLNAAAMIIDAWHGFIYWKDQIIGSRERSKMFQEFTGGDYWFGQALADVSRCLFQACLKKPDDPIDAKLDEIEKGVRETGWERDQEVMVQMIYAVRFVTARHRWDADKSEENTKRLSDVFDYLLSWAADPKDTWYTPYLCKVATVCHLRRLGWKFTSWQVVKIREICDSTFQGYTKTGFYHEICNHF